MKRLILVFLAAGALVATPALAKKKPPPAQVNQVAVADIQSAMDEQRYVDAGRMIDRALIAGSTDVRVVEMSAQLDLARGRYDDALQKFKQVGDAPELNARVKQGQGLAFSMLGRSDEAMAALRAAVVADPMAWRAWNALGGEFDRRQDWKAAEEAYAHAMDGSNRNAIVLNNRGFSRVLQNRLDEGITDLVAALEKKPDLAAARTNLRLAMALKGDYDRALAAGPQEDKAALLNNVGFAALLRGDHKQAQELFNKAIAARGQYYSRASTNLEMATGLQAATLKPGTLNAKP